MLLATIRNWPDAIDLAVIAGYLSGVLAIVGAGYVLMYVDLRAHYRRFRRALVLLSAYTRALPKWVARESPPCVAVFDLKVPFTREELLAAYREKVKHCHPDLGGDRRQFLQLQQYFEQAMSLADDEP